jgi:hypothetical protein
MFSMRALLLSDPFLPAEARAAIARGDAEGHEHLVRLGASACEAAELLDRRCDAPSWPRHDSAAA